MASLNHHDLTLQQDELEALSSIFSDDEFVVVSNSPPYEVQLHVNVPQSNPMSARLHLPHDYPSISPPVISQLSCAGITPVAISALIDQVYLRFEPGGAGCLYNWYNYMNARCILEISRDNKDELLRQTKTTAKDSTIMSRCAILINHMNDSSGYERKLRKWSKQLHLGVDLWWHEKKQRNRQKITKQQQKHRHEHVYCLLSGNKEALRQFQQRLRTEHVDINGSGFKCKERQSRTLALDCSEDYSSATQQQQQQFRLFQYDDNNKGRVPLSNALDAFGCLEQHYSRVRVRKSSSRHPQSKKIVGLVSNYEMKIKGRVYSSEDTFLANELTKRGFIVELILPELLLPIIKKKTSDTCTCRSAMQNQFPEINTTLAEKVDVLLFRNNYGGINEMKYRDVLDHFVQNGNPSLTSKIWNDFNNCRGDYKGKKHLLQLFQMKYPIIPSTINIHDLEKVPFNQCTCFMVKSMSGADSNGMFSNLTKTEARDTFLSLHDNVKCDDADDADDDAVPLYLIQPMVEFVYEVSFVYVNNVFMYAMYNGENSASGLDNKDNKNNRKQEEEETTKKRWELSVYSPTAEDLMFAQKFVDWNGCTRQIQRVDACRTVDGGELLLMELEDYCCWLSLAELKDQRPDLCFKFIDALAHSLYEMG